jgi:butyryl-CoA dehydrogenase
MTDDLLDGLEFLLADARPGDTFTPEDLGEDSRQMGAVAEKLAREEVVPRLGKIDAGDRAAVVDLLRRCGELGLLGADVPEEHGGLALDKATSTLIAEKLGPTGSFGVAFMAHTGIGTLPLVYYGTDEQKARWLPGLVTGETPAAYCLTEPGAGSDAMGARTVATLAPDGKHWLLEGTKQFITNGSFAALYTIFAKVDRQHFTAFLVERGTPGLSAGPEEKKLGIKGSSTTQIVLEEARVPRENVLGEIGKGHKIAFNVLNVGRFKLGAIAMGTAKAAFADGVKYANVRKQFGVPIASFGAIREKVADMAAAIFAAESLVYRLAGLVDRRLAAAPKGAKDYQDAVQRGIEEYAAECAIAKVHGSETLAFVADETLQIHGGYGFTQEYEAERYYRDERINRIFEGTNEINRILVPTTLLRRGQKGGLPLGPAFARARDALASPPPPAAGPLGAERAAVGALKAVFLAATALAAERLEAKLKDEQEVLMALADVAIQIFAAESAVLRAEKARAAGAPGSALLEAAAKVVTFGAVEAAGTAARRAAFLSAPGTEGAALADAVHRCARYDGSGLREAKARLAAAAFEGERYPI